MDLVKSYLGSPIIYENDSRRMRHLIQDKSNCGQVCVAMVSGKRIEEVEALISSNGSQRSDLTLACLALGVPIKGGWTDKRCYPGNPWPPTCLMRVLCKSGGGHILVRFGNWFLDPNGPEFYRLPDEYEFNSYLEIESIMVWVSKGANKYQGDGLIICSPKKIA